MTARNRSATSPEAIKPIKYVPTPISTQGKITLNVGLTVTNHLEWTVKRRTFIFNHKQAVQCLA
jgi:hypothetical protein